MKSEHEKQLIGLERKFQRQLMEARRKNEGLIESLRQTYEDEVDGLKQQRTDLISRGKDLERELERVRGEAEALRRSLGAAEKENALQQRVAETAQRQAELVTHFLERIPGRGGAEMQPVREELSALGGVGGGGMQMPRTHQGLCRPGQGDGRGGNAGNMPYTAANAGVFRSMPGI